MERQRSDDLWEQLNRAWEKGFSIQLSPLLSGEGDWAGRIAIYVHAPVPNLLDKEPVRGRPCLVADLAPTLTKLLDWIEEQP